MKNQGRYSNETKIKAIEMIEKGITYPEIMDLLSISSRGAIRNWLKKYQIGGIEELLKDERGFKTTGRPKKNNN